MCLQMKCATTGLHTKLPLRACTSNAASIARRLAESLLRLEPPPQSTLHLCCQVFECVKLPLQLNLLLVQRSALVGHVLQQHSTAQQAVSRYFLEWVAVTACHGT